MDRYYYINVGNFLHPKKYYHQNQKANDKFASGSGDGDQLQEEIRMANNHMKM